MKSLHKVLNIFALAAVIALLCGCFSPWTGGDATITINVGGGSERAVFPPPDSETLARLSHTVDLQGPSTMTGVQLAPGTQTINLSVIPGKYTITVRAYLDGKLYAKCTAAAEARAGQSTRVDILMQDAREEFTVTFNSNGGDGDVPQSIPVNAGEDITVPGGDGLSKEGYVFGGWCENRGGTGTIYYEGEYYYAVTDDITLFAVWIQDDNAVTVTFDSNGGSYVAPKNITKGRTITQPEDPTRDGYIFDGWYSDNDFTATYDFTIEVYSDTTIYAKWLQQFTVTFNTDGGSPIPAQQTVTQGGKVTQPSNNPTKIGFVFDGWYSSSSLTTTYNFNNQIYSDTTIYAKWNESIIAMVSVPGGSFQMGNPDTSVGFSHERPVHTVTLTGFYMGKYLVTQEQYQAVMGSNPSSFTTAVAGESGTPGKLPVEQVSWYDAIEFCNTLSVQEGLSPYYVINKTQTDPNNNNDEDDIKWTITVNSTANGYRLPTEAQWEYAAKGGDPTAAGWVGYTYSGSDTVGDVGWYNDNSNGMTHEVGKMSPNGLGIYDMSGNVFEWCWDWLGSYTNEAQLDPVGAVYGSGRVIRGGGWHVLATLVRSAHRADYTPSDGDYFIGFRLVRP
jgi:uncharacterized repeat protein (TIGR02543 family)